MFTKNKYLKSCPTIIFEIRGAIIPIKPKIPAAKTLNDVKSAEEIMKNIEYIFLCFTEEKTIPYSYDSALCGAWHAVIFLFLIFQNHDFPPKEFL